MDKDLYKPHYEAEKKGWWAVGRRNLITKNIKSIWKSSEQPVILDFGCGTGGMLDELKIIGVTYGCDTEDLAIEFCKQRGLENIKKLQGNRLPYNDNSFDIIVTMDVLEHIENDKNTINELNRILKNEGFIFVTVPAFMSLWTTRDVRLHHFRRYTKKELQNKIREAGFKIKKCSYMHLFYFLPLLILYKIKFIFKKKENTSDIKTDFSVVPSFINFLLIKALNLETFILKFINFPFGVSLFCIAKKENSSS